MTLKASDSDINDVFFRFLFITKSQISKLTTMKESTKKTWKRVFDIVVTILTALITSLTTTSCLGS